MKFKRGKDEGFSWLKCPACGSRSYFYRSKTDDYQCRKCGQLFKANFSKNKVRRIPAEK